MTRSETIRYRGYDIVPRREWSKWCVMSSPRGPTCPYCHNPHWHVNSRKEEALVEAKQSIDQILARISES